MMTNKENTEEEKGQVLCPLLAQEYLKHSNNESSSSSSSSLTPVVIFSTIVACCGAFAFGCSNGYTSPAQSGIIKDLNLSTGEYSVFGSTLTIGGMIGAIVGGKVADLVGRRLTMWLLEIFCILGWLAIVFAKGALWLEFGRLLMGIGLGIYCYVGPIYIAEITPKEIRGACNAATQLSACLGLLLMYFVGNFINWRTLGLIGTIPCLVQVVGIFFIPESPRWLAKIGREKEVDTTLQRLRGKYADISQEAAEIKDYTHAFQCPSESRFLDLFKQNYANSFFIAVGLVLLVQFGGTSGISFYASSIFTIAGCSVSVGTTTMAIIQIPFSALGIILMDKFGRRPLLMVTAAGACFGSFLAGFAFILQDFHVQKEITSILVMIGMLIYSAFYSMGLTSVPSVIMSEIFPFNIKGQAGSLVTLAGWFGSWIVSYTFNFLYQWSSAGVFLIFGMFCCSIMMFTVKFVPETKGRTLEEIQASMA